MIRWALYFLPDILIKGAAMVLAPLVACFITRAERTDRVKRLGNVDVTMQREYLVTPLYWFQTHDNAVDEYWWGLFTESSVIPCVRNATQEQYDANAFLRYVCRVLWLWRNCAYGFSYHLFGRELDLNDPISISFTGNENSGYWHRITKRKESWQYKAHIPFCPWYQLDINIGWKTHTGFSRAMYAGRLLAFRKR